MSRRFLERVTDYKKRSWIVSQQASCLYLVVCRSVLLYLVVSRCTLWSDSYHFGVCRFISLFPLNWLLPYRCILLYLVVPTCCMLSSCCISLYFGYKMLLPKTLVYCLFRCRIAKNIRQSCPCFSTKAATETIFSNICSFFPGAAF